MFVIFEETGKFGLVSSSHLAIYRVYIYNEIYNKLTKF